MLIGVVLFAGGGFICSRTNNAWLLPIPLVGFLLAAFGGFYRMFLLCPKCHGPMGLAFAYLWNPLGEDLRFCPACGISLDTEYDETQKI